MKRGKRAGVLAMGVLAIAVIGSIGYFWYVKVHPVSTPTPTKTASPANSTVKAVPDPLTIPGIRAHTIAVSNITTEQDLGPQNGYRNSLVSYRSDNLKIYALMSTPNGQPPEGGWPVIILEHGYENPKTYKTVSSEYGDFISTYARNGFVVVKPDYRGHGNSEGDPEGGHFSPVYTYDVLSLVAALGHYDLVNPQRIGQFGHSMGAHEALRAAVVTPNIKATVTMSGVVGSFSDIFYNWPHSPAPNDQPQELTRSKRQALIEAHANPKEDPTFWDSASAINFTSSIVGPVQVNHSVGDSTVPVLFSQHLVAALQKANKTVEYHEYPGDDHQGIANRQALLANSLAFYKAHL